MQNESFFFFFVSFCCVFYYFYITLQRFMVFVCRFLSCLLLLSCLGMMKLNEYHTYIWQKK